MQLRQALDAALLCFSHDVVGLVHEYANGPRRLYVSTVPPSWRERLARWVWLKRRDGGVYVVSDSQLRAMNGIGHPHLVPEEEKLGFAHGRYMSPYNPTSSPLVLCDQRLMMSQGVGCLAACCATSETLYLGGHGYDADTGIRACVVRIRCLDHVVTSTLDVCDNGHARIRSLAVNAQGRLYASMEAVADDSPMDTGIYELDKEKGGILRKLGSGLDIHPGDLAIHPSSGDLVFVDTREDCVVRMDVNGQVKFRTDIRQFEPRPHSLSCDEHRLYVVDNTGAHVLTWPE